MNHPINEIEGDKLAYLVAKCLNLNMDDADTFTTWTGRVGLPGARWFLRSNFEPHRAYSDADWMLEEMAANCMQAGTHVDKEFKEYWVGVRSHLPRDRVVEVTPELMKIHYAHGKTFLLAACRAFCKWKLNSEEANV